MAVIQPARAIRVVAVPRRWFGSGSQRISPPTVVGYSRRGVFFVEQQTAGWTGLLSRIDRSISVDTEIVDRANDLQQRLLQLKDSL